MSCCPSAYPCADGCWGIVSDGICQGGTLVCCESQSNTCGCCNPVDSGEACLDNTYYLTFPTTYSESDTGYPVGTMCYLHFEFYNCTATAATSDITHYDAIFQFFLWFFVYELFPLTSSYDLNDGYGNGSVKLFSASNGSVPSNYIDCNSGSGTAQAEHLYFWTCDGTVALGQYSDTSSSSLWQSNGSFIAPLSSILTGYSLDNCCQTVPGGTTKFNGATAINPNDNC